MACSEPQAGFLSVVEAGQLIASGSLDVRALTDAYLDRIGRLNHTLGAFITVRADSARNEAGQAFEEIRAGHYRGPLHGIAIALKDSIDSAGDVTSAGSTILLDNVASRDAVVVARLRKLGAIVLGKLSLMEFSMGDEVNPFTGGGQALNPWNLARSASGSSSGAGVAVAAGLCSAALGTDTGGSVRLPAAYCGIVGMKPTFGRLSVRGIIPAAPSLDCVGPMTRTVMDNALLLGMLGRSSGLPHAAAGRGASFDPKSLAQGVRGVRIGVPRRFFFEYAMPEVCDAVLSALRRLENQGARVVEIDLPHAHYAVAAWTLIALAEMAVCLEKHVRGGLYARFTDLNRIQLDLAYFISATDYIHAQRLRTFLRRDFTNAWRKADVIIAPAAPVEAHEIADDAAASSLPIRLAPIGPTTLQEMICRMTVPASLAGIPALSLPVGFSRAGLPLGAQIMGRHFDESTVYRVAFAYEQSESWYLQHPQL